MMHAQSAFLTRALREDAMSRLKTFVTVLFVACLLSPSLHAAAKKPVSPIKKTMDGRCLTKTHSDYWKTKIYVAKPTVAACLASGGRKV